MAYLGDDTLSMQGILKCFLNVMTPVCYLLYVTFGNSLNNISWVAHLRPNGKVFWVQRIRTGRTRRVRYQLFWIIQRACERCNGKKFLARVAHFNPHCAHVSSAIAKIEDIHPASLACYCQSLTLQLLGLVLCSSHLPSIGNYEKCVFSFLVRWP